LHAPLAGDHQANGDDDGEHIGDDEADERRACGAELALLLLQTGRGAEADAAVLKPLGYRWRLAGRVLGYAQPSTLDNKAALSEEGKRCVCVCVCVCVGGCERVGVGQSGVF
jgi:hypothetical protein